MIPALTVILGFQLIGALAARGLGVGLPGPVIGMLLLTGACVARPALAERLRPVTRGLLMHLSLFFVPAGVGVIAHGPVLAAHGIGLAVALVVSTLLALVAGGLAFAAVARLTGNTPEGEDAAPPGRAGGKRR